MFWINFLHFYQPSNADAHIIKEATEKSYLRIVRALEANPHLRFTLNISGCLIHRWQDLGYADLFRRLRRLIDRGQIELTGTAAYHPILPLVPLVEAGRQIDEHEQIVRHYLGKKVRLRGFFFPEMAYGPDVARFVAAKGYEWMIVDELCVNGTLGSPLPLVSRDARSGLLVVARSRSVSSQYVPAYIQKHAKAEDTIVTATDAELYGLRHIDHTAVFERVAAMAEVRTATVSELVKQTPGPKNVRLTPCSWETTVAELKAGKPYALWQNPNNQIHQQLWDFTRFAYRTVERYRDDENYHWARWHLVRGLASCAFWWASERDFSDIFGPRAWNPDEIERGLNELIRAVRALSDLTTRGTKIKAEHMYLDIKHRIWEKHWTKYWNGGGGRVVGQ